MCRHLRGLDRRWLPITIALFVLAARNGFAQQSGVGTVVDNFLIPIPEPDGICSDGTSFWIPNRALDYGPQRIYKINIWTREITDSIPAPDRGPDGIAWDGSALWVRALYPNIDTSSLVRESTNGTILSHIPAVGSCYWAGIAWDGKDLYYGTNVCFASPKGQKSMIYKVSPKSGAVIDSIPPPSGNINGLVYNEGDLWYCDDNNGYIFEIDTTGKIIREFSLPQDQVSFHGPLSGLTIAKHYLWAVDMAGVGGPRIYGIDIGETPAIPQDLAAFDGENIPLKTRLTWQPSASTDIEWYKIYRGPMGPYGSGVLTKAAVIDSVPGNVTTFTDTTATVGLTFAYWVSAVDSNGVESFVSNETDGYVWSPYSFKLGQNYPNPFSRGTTIPFEVPAGEGVYVEIGIYDVLGRKLKTLVDGAEPPGDQTVVFNAAGFPSGIYLCRMQAGAFTKTIKIALIR